jgi:hypothetical protein
MHPIEIEIIVNLTETTWLEIKPMRNEIPNGSRKMAGVTNCAYRT